MRTGKSPRVKAPGRSGVMTTGRGRLASHSSGWLRSRRTEAWFN
jgi:hypothetical protein